MQDLWKVQKKLRKKSNHTHTLKRKIGTKLEQTIKIGFPRSTLRNSTNILALDSSKRGSKKMTFKMRINNKIDESFKTELAKDSQLLVEQAEELT
jgi:hypothetical protein